MSAPPAARQTSVHRIENPDRQASSDRRRLPLVGPSKRSLPTPEQPLIISASELRDFLRCRVKWHWRHQCRLEPVRGTEALSFGTLVHKIMEGFYTLDPAKRTRKRMAKISDNVLKTTTITELSTDDFELIKAMCVGYAAWCKEPDAAIGVGVGTPEQWFDLPLDPDGCIRVRGKIDNVFKSTIFKKTMGCLEFKSKKQIQVDMVDTNLQLSVYLWALRQLYPKAKRYRAEYTILRKQMPGPRVKADLFHREPVERQDDEIDQWALDTSRVALDMLDAAIYPTPDDNCSWSCDFQIPCLLRGRPDDLEHVLSTGYRPRVYRA